MLLRLDEGSFGDVHRSVLTADRRGGVLRLKLLAALDDPLLVEVLPPLVDARVGALFFFPCLFLDPVLVFQEHQHVLSHHRTSMRSPTGRISMP